MNFINIVWQIFGCVTDFQIKMRREFTPAVSVYRVLYEILCLTAQNDKRMQIYFVPVDPKPPAPRSVSSKSAASSTGITETGITTSCAMRSPGWTVYGSWI